MLNKISSLQAHIVFGVIFIFLSIYQNNLNLGWNVNTLTHLIIILTILSGIVGIYANLALSCGSSETVFIKKTDELIDLITLIDRFLLDTAFVLPHEIQQSVITSVKTTRVDIVKIIDAGILKGLLPADNSSTAVTLVLLNQYEDTHQIKEEQWGKIKYWLENKITLYAEFRNIIQARYYLDLWKMIHSQLIIGSLVFASLYIINLNL